MKTQVKVRSLKIFSNNSAGDWDIVHFAHIYDTFSARINITAISDTCFAVSLGKTTQIWEAVNG